MKESIIFDFGWVLLFAILAGMLSMRLRIPPVAGLLVAGMLMGPNVFGFVQMPTIEVFAEIGAVLLLFMIGVQFSITKLLSSGLRPVISSFILILITFMTMHEVAILLNFDPLSALLIASMFSFSSTAIMIKILEHKGLVQRQEVPILVTMLIIEDIVAIFMITFFSSMSMAEYNSENVIGAIILSLGILVFSYVVLMKVAKTISGIFMRYQAEDTPVLFSFSLGMGMSILASMLGLSPAIGAFLAGSIISGLPNGKYLEAAIKPFGQVFSSFFFLSVGMMIDPSALLSNAGVTLILIGSFMFTVFFAVTFAFFLISSSGKSSVFAGIAMLPLGEFSLLIASVSTSMVQTDLVAIASLGVLLTSIVGSFSLGRSRSLYSWMKKKLPRKFLGKLKESSNYFRSVISAFEPKGYFHSMFTAELKKGALDFAYLVFFLIVYFGLRSFFQFKQILGGNIISGETVLLLVFALLILAPSIRILSSVKRLFDALSVIFSRTTPQTSKGTIVRNIAISGVLFLLFANLHSIVSILALPKIMNWFSLVFGILSVFFMWSAVRAASFRMSIRKSLSINLLSPRIIVSDVIIVGQGQRKRKYAFREMNMKSRRPGPPKRL